MFYWATLVTHDLFNTDTTDRFVNQTTSYVDLGWLYGGYSVPLHYNVSLIVIGWNQEMQDSVRDKKGYRGKLYPDVFADYRLVIQPPGVPTMALLFNRNHNWIAEQLLIKSKDDYRFASIPEDDDIEGLERLDEHLFQTARNINVGTFITAVLYDYVRMLLGINRVNTTWTLPIPNDFTTEPKDLSPIGKDIPKATGNQCSIEFNFIYRWHSAIAVEDEKWVENTFKEIGPKGISDDIGANIPFQVPTMIKAMKSRLQVRKETPPTERDYFIYSGGLTRDKSGRFPDAALAEFLHKGTDYAAGAFGGRQVPEVLKPVEVMGILHGRQLGVCTLNELRTLCNLREYKTFSEMNSDPEIASALEELYGDVSLVELYPGLVAEEAKPKQAATGLCAGRTITYGILSDAVALVRGDRFLTTELNPYNLTTWGFDEIQPDLTRNFGCVLGDKLLNRHLGEKNCPRDSIYTQFPFSTPQETKTNILSFGLGELYRETRKPTTNSK
jgi:Animal haem peroxidase